MIVKLSHKSTMIAKSFSLVKFSALWLIVNAHLLAGAAMHYHDEHHVVSTLIESSMK